MSAETFRIGLLGHGTVGGAFHELLEQRADAVVTVTGMRPEIVGVLTRSHGDFDELLERSDLYREIAEKGAPDRVFLTRKPVEREVAGL
jgi:homoserine dehydrogenase